MRYRIAMQVADRLLVRPLDFKVGHYDPVNSAIGSATVSAVYTLLAKFNLEKISSVYKIKYMHKAIYYGHAICVL